ncbi:MAG: hypothetical protein LBL87_04805 [Ruminococcus sp.]|jgi:hypothetical protein|nr:hypothetical protein [Ruminococcus sp.]
MKLEDFKRITISEEGALPHRHFKTSEFSFYTNNPNGEFTVYFGNLMHIYYNDEDLEDFWNDPIFNGKSISEIIGEVEYLGDEL